jgi:hypothetical protein
MKLDVTPPMTTRRKFSGPERFGLWKAWDGKCGWCAEQVIFRDIEVDHLIPINAVSSAEDRQKIITFYGLPAEFDFASLENCLPSCSRCNRLKSDRTFESSPALVMMLSIVRMLAPLARAIAEKFVKDEKRAKILVRIETAVTRGDVTKEDIETALAGLPTMIRKGGVGQPPAISLHVAPGWEVVEERGHLLIVRTASGRLGHTSKSNDPSWICPSCGNKGPWQGVICLSCGRMSGPDD